MPHRPFDPVRFGAEVIDRFGSYLTTTFPVAHVGLEQQIRDAVTNTGTRGGGRIARGPFVFLNRPFESGPSLRELVAEPELGLHPALPGVFPFERLHRHQERALRSIQSGRHTLVATGTGSGKTEAFLLPIVDHCLRLRDAGAAKGVVALIVYPMNALVDDQLRRLRPLLAGTGILFGRYTGATPRDGAPPSRVTHGRAYDARERELLEEGRDEEVPLPFEECWSRAEIRERRPRVLLSNYAQLEYLLLRDRDLDIFRGAELRFLVLDEVHSYTGALGSEVACLVRRLRQVAGRKPEEMVCVGTSATVQDEHGELDGVALTRRFAQRLFGVPADAIEVVGESYRELVRPEAAGYTPPAPSAARGLLEALLVSARPLHLREEVEEISEEIRAAMERLCGRPAPAGASGMERARALLAGNRLLWTLQDVFRRPLDLRDALPRMRALGRKDASDGDLIAELLAYLVLGALVHDDGEPLLRPKLHWFVQGFLGLGFSYDANGAPRVEFESEKGHAEDGSLILPMVLCRSCGQHYAALVSDPQLSLGAEGGYFETRLPAPEDELPDDEDESTRRLYLTEKLVGRDEGDGAEIEELWLCRVCGAGHPRVGDRGAVPDRCRSPHCGRPGALVSVHAFRGLLKACLACGTQAKGYEEIVTPVRSADVAAIAILSQSMLSAMPEVTMRRLLVFSDNRQEAAFQAGWMEERSQRFRLRHLLYAILDGDHTRTWSVDDLTAELIDRGTAERVLREEHHSRRENETRVGWFLAEEFFATGQRRGSLESLALASVEMAGLSPSDAPEFYAEWCAELGLEASDLYLALLALADYYRRRGLVSHPLLGRHWSYQDREVREGWVRIHEHHHPLGLVPGATGGARNLKGWISPRGRSGAQAVLASALPGGASSRKETRDELLEAVWGWWTGSGILRRITLVRKRSGRTASLELPTLWQLDVERVGFRWSDRRHVCGSCRRAQSRSTPSGLCPEYDCKGVLRAEDRPVDHFDVLQYTRGDFVPLLPREHSAQVPRAERREAELEFKKEQGGRFNCLVATPTLELGVDIGKLEMVLHRNVPPTPASYAQRAGRAGRRHRIAVVFTFCGGGAHDRYFYGRPEEVIAGRIRVPAFSMRNEPLVRKHVHSSVLGALRAGASEASAEAGLVREVLQSCFPTWVREWFSRLSEEDDERVEYLDGARDLSGLRKLVADRRASLLETTRAVFQETWPPEDAHAVCDERLVACLEGMEERLSFHVRRLFDRVQGWRQERNVLIELEKHGELKEAERARKRQLESALWKISRPDRENYALSWLSADGFFPGYALTRESVSALALDPFLEVFRPAPVGIRELSPSNFVYANRNVFRPRRVFLESGPQAVRGARGETVPAIRLLYDPDRDRVEAPGERPTEGGVGAPREVHSYRLVEVELQRRQEIGDREPYRRRVRFHLLGWPLATHGGGQHGRIGSLEVRLLELQDLRLINLGELRREPERFSLFPMCGVCGETRSARASQAELDAFAADHTKRHGGRPIGSYALHVELRSDALHLGPFAERGAAENVFESLRLGARQVLDMGETELEGFTRPDERDGWWTVLYDPTPGGSGFLPELVEHWALICSRAADALEHCPGRCERACYACLLHFWNQHLHAMLDRHAAVNELRDLARAITLSHSIPPVHRSTPVDPAAADSAAEFDFAEGCRRHGMPVPDRAQFRVDLDDGSSTVADWAWVEHRILVFVDGMSRSLHGDPRSAREDRLKRARCRMKGFRVVEISAEAVNDSASLAVHLDEIAIYLGSGR